MLMLRRTCQALASRLQQLHLLPVAAPAATFASRPNSRPAARPTSRRGKLVSDLLREERDRPGYLNELEETKQMMNITESRSHIGAAYRAQIRAANRAAVRRKVAAAKAAKLRPPELNLLTWAAKRQLVELAAAEPDLWTPLALSEAFPVSVEQAGRLVKKGQRSGGLTLRDPAEIYRHDRRVLERLRQLEGVRKTEDGRPKAEDVEPGFEWLVRSDKWHLLPHAAGNPVLPLPQQQLVEDLLEAAARRPVGPFEALLRQQEAAQPRRARLQAFIALCEQQKAQVEAAVRAFTAEETKEKYREAGLLARPAQEAERPEGAPQQHLTMFAAAVAAPKPPAKEVVVPEEVEERGRTSFGELVEKLEADSGGLPKSSSKLNNVRSPLNYQSRVNMDRLRIFRYSFDLKEEEVG